MFDYTTGEFWLAIYGAILATVAMVLGVVNHRKDREIIRIEARGGYRIDDSNLNTLVGPGLDPIHWLTIDILGEQEANGEYCVVTIRNLGKSKFIVDTISFDVSGGGNQPIIQPVSFAEIEIAPGGYCVVATSYAGDRQEIVRVKVKSGSGKVFTKKVR